MKEATHVGPVSKKMTFFYERLGPGVVIEA